MNDEEQIESVLAQTPEPARDDLARDFADGRMTVDEFMYGEDDDRLNSAGAAGMATDGGCLVWLLIAAVAGLFAEYASIDGRRR